MSHDPSSRPISPNSQFESEKITPMNNYLNYDFDECNEYDHYYYIDAVYDDINFNRKKFVKLKDCTSWLNVSTMPDSPKSRKSHQFISSSSKLIENNNYRINTLLNRRTNRINT